jgi:hypothetical protein
MLVWGERQSWLDHPEHRSNDVAGDCSIGLEASDNVDSRRVEQDLLIGFAERSGGRAFTRLDAAARECDLARVGSQMLAPNRQQYARLGTIGHRDEDGCLVRRPRSQPGVVALQRAVGRSSLQRGSKPVTKPAH